MKYVVVSAVATDEIHFFDGTIKIAKGGAGIYALTGIKLWSDDVLIATGIGEDYKALNKDWYEKNNISMKGLKVKDAKSPYTIINYFADGEREEIPQYGLSHFKNLETTALELKGYFKTSEGIYIFKNTDEDFWRDVLTFKKGSKSKVMWEIGADATFFENLENVKKITSEVEALSINITEAKNLFNSDNIDYIVEELKKLNLELVFFRMGKDGAIMISKNETVHVPIEENITVVDPTGGGNSSTGAVLCGFIEKRPLFEIGKMGAISAGICISDYGVPDIIEKQQIRKQEV